MDENCKRKRDDNDTIINDNLISNKKQKVNNFKEVSENEILQRTEREFTTVIVKNLPKNTNIKTINGFFEKCGEIKNTKFIKNIQLAKIQFSDREEMMSALTMNFKHFNNNDQSNIITVEPYENSSLWMTNYPPEYSYLDLKNLFEKTVGKDTVFEVRLPSLKFNSNKRFAYIDLISNKHCIEAINSLNDIVIDKYKLIVKLNQAEPDLNRTKNDTSKEDIKNINAKELYLTNLRPENKDEDIFNSLKEKCGCLTIPNEQHFEFPIKRPTTKKHIGFVMFKNVDCISKIIDFSKNNNNDFFVNMKKNKVFYQKVESKGYLERVKFKKMIQYGTKYRDYNQWVSLFPLIEDKINHFNKFQFQNFLQNEIANVQVLEVLLISDYKGVLVKLNNEASASKLKLKFDNTDALKFNNTTYAKGNVKCRTILDLVNSANSSNISKVTTNKEHKTTDLTKKELKVDLKTNLQPVPTKDEVKPNQVMSNDDFRNLFK